VVCQAATSEAPTKKYHPSPLSQAPPPTYAIIEVGGKQMFVEPGKWYTVNRLKADVGSKIKFGRVLALKKEEKLTVGAPYLETVNVSSFMQNSKIFAMFSLLFYCFTPNHIMLSCVHAM
jgi:hypothetical protein